MSIGLSDNPGQLLVCVGPGGKEIGRTVDRRSAHIPPGVKHLAIQVLVFNPNGELVLHERPAKKVGGGVLDAPTTHVLAGETPIDAALRCLADEYGIIEKGTKWGAGFSGDIGIKIAGGFSYEKDYGDGSCENEYCLAAFVVFGGKIFPDAEHAGKIVCVSAKKVLEETGLHSVNYPVWFRETVRLVNADRKGRSFFE